MPPELDAELADALQDVRRVRAEELRSLAEILQSFDLAADVGPLHAAASEALGAFRRTSASAPDPGRWYWGYVIDGLQLQLDDQWKSIPKSSVFDSSTLTISVQEYVPETVEHVAAGYLNLRIADVNFSITGLCEHSDGVSTVQSAWHVDTHLHPEATTTSHPRHHFQFGGRRLEELDEQIRAVWVPDTPRLLTLPMDGILGIDFVLSHYAGRGWNEVQQDARYLALRRDASLRYWRPVVEAISDFFAAERLQASDHFAVRLLPNLLWA
jgi:hypothetical protein